MTDSPNEYRFGFSLAMLQHAQSQKLLYKAMVGKKGGGLVLQHLQHMFTGLVRAEIAEILPNSASLKVPHNIIVAFVAAEVDQIFHKLTFSGVSSLQANQ